MPVPVVTVDPALPTLTSPTPELPFDPAADDVAELARQVAAYRRLGVLDVLGVGADDLLAAATPLLGRIGSAPAVTTGLPDDRVPFVLVLPGLDLNATAPAMRRGARPGVCVIDDVEAATYLPIDDVEVPASPYLLVGVDVGSELCSVPPETALATVRGRGRTPLTIAEGVCLVVVRPDMLRPNRCFSLAGSRAGNQRVPAVWISERRAKLGWCWDRNPHTWLGTASASARVG